MIRIPLPLLLAALLLAPGPGIHAQATPPGRTAAATGAQPKARALPHPGDRACLRSTGSLIPAKPGRCLPVAGRSYSQEDLRRTGAVNTSDALRMLDPNIH